MVTLEHAVRIICVGHAALDRVYRVPAWPATSAKVRASAYRESGGGMAANAAAAIARLGGHPAFWGPVGDDAIAECLAEELRAIGVDVSAMKRIPGTHSSHSAILVDDHGERLIVGLRGEGLTDPGDWLPIAQIGSARAVLVDVRWPDGARRALAAARDAGVPALLDADTADRSILEALVGLADYAIFSETGLAAFAGAGDDQALGLALARGSRVAIVTRGPRGATWLARESPSDFRTVAPPAVGRIVDTTGAGDVFHGAFALAIGEGRALIDALRFANAAAALKCSMEGARAPVTRAMVDAVSPRS